MKDRQDTPSRSETEDEAIPGAGELDLENYVLYLQDSCEINKSAATPVCDTRIGRARRARPR